MTESDVMNSVRIALSEHGVVFRTNSGEFWQGSKIYSKEFKQMVLVNIRKVQGLPKGFSDLLYVGKGNVAFIETKNRKGKPTKEQEHFIEVMKKYGHIAGVARSVEDAIKLIKEG